MKKLKSIFMVFCLLLFIYPMEVKAEETKSEFFTVNLEVGEHNCVAPGDIFTETFTIKNTYNKPIRVRVCKVSNVEDSVLYSALKAGWINGNSPVNFGSFDNLTTDWFSIGVGQSLDMELDMYFPFELGNEYQATKLIAEFTFECRVPKDAVNAPDTGDTSQLVLWASLTAFSGLTFLILLFFQKRKREEDEQT